jgi:glycerophosphoryl diester phosphodiesterase
VAQQMMMIFKNRINKTKKVWMIICTFFLLIYSYLNLYYYDKTDCNLEDIENKILGHRGLRGYFPENSILGFIESLKHNISDLELDVVITKDSILVINHDTYINSDICDNLYEDISISELNFRDLNNVTCGNRQNSNFPLQKETKYSIPSLFELLDTTSKLIVSKEVKYYIEIKSPSQYKSKFKPTPDILVGQLIKEFSSRGISDQLIIQSFDPNILNLVKQQDRNIKVCLLVSNLWSIDRNLNKLEFKPEFYALYHRLYNKSKLEKLKKLKIKTVAWTVNSFYDMKRLSCIGVDKIMSDYPLLKYNDEGTPVHNIR